MHVETFGGPCPRCGFDVCFVRYGTGTWYAFIACPDCLFGYGQNSDSHDHSKGKTSGTTIFAQLLDQFDVSSVEELRDIALESGRIEDHTVFNFDYEEEALMMDSCVADPHLLRRIGYEVDMDRLDTPRVRAPSMRSER